MTSPRSARDGGKSGRYYTFRNENFWSVTNILNALAKPALTYWAANEAANFACDNAEHLAHLVENDREAAYDMIRRAPWRNREKAADLGTLLHSATEAYVLGKPFPKVPKKAEGYMESFRAYLDAYTPEVIATEMSVYSRRWHYAGTLDRIEIVDGRRLLTDTKTGKVNERTGSGIYPEIALQLSAYRHAEFAEGADGSEIEMPQVDGCAALHLRADGSFEFLDVRADEEVFQSFLHIAEAFRWQEERSKTVLLGPLQTGGNEAERAFREALATEPV